tara:strand:- start:4764 stop:7367 length:2604 start_codon:yes stop_codon:yes gene_type:complete
MAFDAKTFLQSGGNPGAMLGAFGLPSCMIGLASDVLGLIPSPILLAMRMAMEEAQRLANAAIKRINSYIRDKLGISLFPDRDGYFGFLSEYSRFGLDVISGIGAAIGTFMGFAAAAIALADEFEARLTAAKDCLENYKNHLDFSNGNAVTQPGLDPAGYSDLINSQFGVWFEQTQIAEDFVNSVEEQKNQIDAILLARTLDPSLEPGQEGLGVVESVFRLDAGPPKSTSGKFVLSVDGLYYDSQTSGIAPALLELADREQTLEFGTRGFTNPNLWKLEHDPSLGGRGIPTTSKDLEFYFNSILDPNILDNSKGLTAYYNQDELLLSLEGQKDRKIFDVSEEIQELIDDGESQAVIDNLRQAMLSETSYFQNKIDKRKKQVELAVKVPVWMGRGPLYEHGKIPVNDFSYLAGSNFLVDIKSQREITINQADVEGVVLPLVVKYTEKIETNDPITLNHLLLANIARGETINTALGTSASMLHINDRIIEDQLFALYNYLTIETSVPSGTDFGVYNGGGNGIGYNAQIVGEASSIFTKGLGIPFLSGVAFPEEGNLSAIESMGTYVKAPARNEFKDLLYNTKGATFETWIHMPDLDGTTTSWNMHDSNTLGLYRLILANENVGISESKVPQPDINNLDIDNGTGVVRGLVYGFTRDRRFTLGLDPSNNEVDNSIENLVLVLAPTQSYDSSSAGFIANRTANCNKDSYHGMTVPVWEMINNKSLSSCGTSFCQLSVSLDPVEDEIRIYLDGVRLATSSYQGVFGTARPGTVFKAPSVKQNNSFEYSGGPSLDAYFTPWIIGGGYTDGNPDGNFMGGEYGGKVSGLKGYVGCSRFYSKPLKDGDVLNNYKATQNFFKNVEVPNSLWEPLEIP